jgi:alkylation response protein AidB-like acyl-CoA dehydrogenase
MHQVLIGEAEMELEQVHLWARRQLLLETAEPEILSKADVVKNWRLSKGSVCEGAFTVTQLAIKMCGTSGALMDNELGRAFRDAAMGLVQAFPAERGKLDLAQMVVAGHGSAGFTTIDKGAKDS